MNAIVFVKFYCVVFFISVCESDTVCPELWHACMSSIKEEDELTLTVIFEEFEERLSSLERRFRTIEQPGKINRYKYKPNNYILFEIVGGFLFICPFKCGKLVKMTMIGKYVRKGLAGAHPKQNLFLVGDMGCWTYRPHNWYPRIYLSCQCFVQFEFFSIRDKKFSYFRDLGSNQLTSLHRDMFLDMKQLNHL